jgi:hypothetical protein
LKRRVFRITEGFSSVKIEEQGIQNNLSKSSVKRRVFRITEGFSSVIIEEQ